MASNQIDPSIIHLKIDKNHMVKTGFMEHYNELMLTTVYNAYLDKDSGLLTLQREKGDICIPFTLTGLADVDVASATAGQVLSYSGSNWIAVDGGGIFDYVRNDPSTRHTDILNVSSVTDALDKILYPYEEPSFSSFSIQGLSSTLELGEYVSSSSGGVETFQWGVTKLPNISLTEGFTITDITTPTTLQTGILPNTTTSQNINIPYGIAKTTNGATHQFKIQTKDTQGSFFNRTATYRWRPRMYWGVLPQDSILNSAQIISLASTTTGGSKLVSDITESFTMNGGGEYIWIAQPQSFGKAIDADYGNSRFIVGGLPNSAWELFSMNFTNQYGHIEPFYLYRTSTVQFGAGIGIQIV